MTDTTKSPDEPDGNWSVSTRGMGGDGAVAPDVTGAPGGNGNGGSVPRRPSPGPATAGHPGQDTPAAPAPGAPGEVPVAAASDDRLTSGESAAPGSNGAPSGSGADPEPQVPPAFTAGGSLAEAGTGPSGFSPEPPSAPEAGEPVAPTPAPGPVPNPGPGAAAPPPWRRMPDHDTATIPSDTGPPPEESGTSLLDDVPTAFVEPAGSPDAGTAAQPSSLGSVPSSDRAGWSSMRTRARAPRRAVLQLKRFDPWSVLKLALVLAGVLFLVWMVAVGLLYGVLDGMGVWDRLNGTYSDLVSGDGASGGQTLISAWRVFGYAALFGVVNSVLAAVAVTVSAFLYNVSADLVGGIELTMSEPE